ncbi:hypothetical protein LguiA_031353 [Lonicera macranthoides]
MTDTKRAYKLQEFVAHASNVNCLKIGRKSSRVLVTGGEDHKVNLWAIGKPNSILSLSGHSSGIDSVNFDSSEVLIAAGAASGTIKIWDLEEAKIVRTLTGHRSNAISLDFHPFGEFFASGSLDTNLKIWDIRRKGCIHTYKGHTRGVNAIRFTPDGRWVVSGGQDNTVKLWDLTAGKLLHDFKCHEGQIQCIDFHPHEFLLATGSADRTVKFWDLETFELIGSAGPETTGVRCMTFNPDGRTLLCGLHESLKVFSWEPIRSHDVVDVGWSRLSDLNIHEGKLLGCSYNQSCVGVWVVDISRIEPYAVGDTTRLNDHSVQRSNSSRNMSLLTENATKDSLGRLSISQNSDPVGKLTKSVERSSVPQSPDPIDDSKSLASTGTVPGVPQRINSDVGPRTNPITSMVLPNTTAPRRTATKIHSTANTSIFNMSDVAPVVVPRDNNARLEHAAEIRKGLAARTMPLSLQSKASDFRKISDVIDELERPNGSEQGEAFKATESSGDADRNIKDNRIVVSGKLKPNVMMESNDSYQHQSYDGRVRRANRDPSSMEGQKGGRTRLLVGNREKKEGSPDELASTNLSGVASVFNTHPTNMRGFSPCAEKELMSASEDDVIADLVEHHDQIISSLRSRLAKLQIVHNYWERNDVKGAISAMEKMADHGVLADVVGFLTERTDIVTLDICTCLLPLLASLLESDMDRHQGISLEMLLKLVRVFGSMIYSSLSASSPVGVDIEAEQRLERCNLCFIELEKVKRCLPVLTRRGGSVAKFALELNLALQEVS